MLNLSKLHQKKCLSTGVLSECLRYLRYSKIGNINKIIRIFRRLMHSFIYENIYNTGTSKRHCFVRLRTFANVRVLERTKIENTPFKRQKYSKNINFNLVAFAIAYLIFVLICRHPRTQIS